MSVSRPASCLFRCSAAIPIPSSISRIRPFHSTSIRHGRRRPQYPSISQAQLSRIENEAKNYPEYTAEELAALKHHYTPEQFAALEVAEKAIDNRDLATQGAFRQDHWRVNYLDDFTTLDPFLDKKQVKEPSYAGRVRPIGEQEFERHLEERQANRDFDPRSTQAMFRRAEERKLSDAERTFLNNLKRYIGTDREFKVRRLLRMKYVGKESFEQPSDPANPTYGEQLVAQGADPNDPLWLVQGDGKELGLDEDYSALAVEVPKFEDPRIRWPFGEDDNPNAQGLKRLGLQTGFSQEEIKRFRVKNLVMHRVVNQTRMGKIASMYNLTIAGNGNGLLGIGEGKSAEPEDSRRQAMVNAIRNMKPIHRYEDRTIYGEVHGKVGAVEVKLSSRPPGFGIRCHHLIFEMCRCAGIADLAARSTRSRNPMNTVKATFEALTSQRLPEDIARARGRKLVDVRKVYYAGKVY